MEGDAPAVADAGDAEATEATGDIKTAKQEAEEVVTFTEAAIEEGDVAQEAAGEVAIVGEGGEELDGEHVEGENVECEHKEVVRAEDVRAEGEYVEGERAEGEHGKDEELQDELKEKEDKDIGEEDLGEELEGEGGKEVGEEKKEVMAAEEFVEEEEAYIEEPPPDPTAPFNFSDSTEALKEPFELRPEQLAEVELLWETYQNYTPAYTDIQNYITTKELVYLLKSLFLMTVTEEQFYELIEYCVRPPHPKGHISFDQFVKMVTLRQRDFLIEDELRSALQVFDPEKTGLVDRENLKEVLAKQGNKMPQRQLENLIKEVDMANDGTLGIEDIIGTMCIDLNKEDLMMLRESIYPSVAPPPLDDGD